MLKITVNHIKAANPPQFAKLLGVTTSTIYRWLDGGEANTASLQKAAKKLNIPFTDFWDLLQNWLAEENERRLLQREIDDYFSSNKAA